MKNLIQKLILLYFVALSFSARCNNWEKVFTEYNSQGSAIIKLDSGGYLLFQNKYFASKLRIYSLRLSDEGDIINSIPHVNNNDLVCRIAQRSNSDKSKYILQYQNESIMGYYYMSTDSNGNYLSEFYFNTFPENSNNSNFATNQCFLKLKNTEGVIGYGYVYRQLNNGFIYDPYIYIRRFNLLPYVPIDKSINLRENMDSAILDIKASELIVQKIFPLKNGGFDILISIDKDTTLIVSNSYYLARFDSTGIPISTVLVSNSTSSTFNYKSYEDKFGNSYFTYSESTNKAVVVIRDSTGNITNTILTPTLASMPYSTIVKRINNDLLLIYSLTENSIQKYRAFFKGVFSVSKNEYVYQKFSSIFTGLNGEYDFFVSTSELFLDDAILFIGTSKNISNSKNALTIIKLDDKIYPQLIKGNVYGDFDHNCIKNSDDLSLSLFTVKAKIGNSMFYTTSDSLGNYELEVDTGNVELNLYRNISKPLWLISNCNYTYIFTVHPNDTLNYDFALDPKLICPFLSIDIVTPFLRRCVENTYTITYKNNGTSPSFNSYIDVKLDSFLHFLNASVPVIYLGDFVYRFNIGFIGVDELKSFNVNVYLDCIRTIPSQTHCVESHIYPDTICSSSSYNGPIITATAKCFGDRVEFTLKNNGSNMLIPRKYQIIEDHVIRKSQEYLLNRGGSETYSIKTDNGATYRILVEQDPNYPIEYGDKFVIAFTEGCRSDISQSFTTGIITSDYLYDGEPYRSLNCTQSIASHDPNDKIGFPIGVGSSKFINQNTPIDYLIRFQNTGNDTAFKVIIDDTISNNLDINSISNLQSSHSFIFNRIDTNVVRWVFNNIKLVDSTTNEKLSNGFVKFRIQQKKDLAIGIHINNKAEIYFDYNSAVITNTTLHTIGKDFLRVDLISTIINDTTKIKKIKVLPNPFDVSVEIIIDGEIINNAVLELTDVYGNLISKYVCNNNSVTIFRNEFPSGMYLYIIKQNNTVIANGKLIAK